MDFVEFALLKCFKIQQDGAFDDFACHPQVAVEHKSKGFLAAAHRPEEAKWVRCCEVVNAEGSVLYRPGSECGYDTVFSSYTWITLISQSIDCARKVNGTAQHHWTVDGTAYAPILDCRYILR